MSENWKVGETAVYLAEPCTIVQLPREIRKEELKADEPQYKVRFGAPIRLEWVRAELLRRPANRL